MFQVGDTVEIIKGTRKGLQFSVTRTYIAFNGTEQVILDIPQTADGLRRFAATSLRKI